MFTGIIEHLGTISRLETSSSGGKLSVHAPTLASQLAVSASVAVNGCCLTVVHHDQQHFSADLSPETLAKTTFRELKTGARVNLEQPLTAGKESTPGLVKWGNVLGVPFLFTLFGFARWRLRNARRRSAKL